MQPLQISGRLRLKRQGPFVRLLLEELFFFHKIHAVLVTSGSENTTEWYNEYTKDFLEADRRQIRDVQNDTNRHEEKFVYCSYVEKKSALLETCWKNLIIGLADVAIRASLHIKSIGKARNKNRTIHQINYRVHPFAFRCIFYQVFLENDFIFQYRLRSLCAQDRTQNAQRLRPNAERVLQT